MSVDFISRSKSFLQKLAALGFLKRRFDESVRNKSQVCRELNRSLKYEISIKPKFILNSQLFELILKLKWL
jgi:hypothetical protein